MKGFLGMRLELGILTYSELVKQAIESNPALAGEIVTCLMRHQTGDWGDDLDDWDRHYNDNGVRNGQPVLSRYKTTVGPIWIVTAGDRVQTLVIAPVEYRA